MSQQPTQPPPDNNGSNSNPGTAPQQGKPKKKYQIPNTNSTSPLENSTSNNSLATNSTNNNNIVNNSAASNTTITSSNVLASESVNNPRGKRKTPKLAAEKKGNTMNVDVSGQSTASASDVVPPPSPNASMISSTTSASSTFKPSEHDNKRFSQVLLLCGKCNACLAANTFKGNHMFSVFKDDRVRHAILKDQNAIGNSMIEKENISNSKNSKKGEKYKKTHMLYCTNCNQKVGSRFPGNFPKTEIPKRMFDGDDCKVSCKDLNNPDGQDIVMRVKEWRTLSNSLRDYGLYPPPHLSQESLKSNPKDSSDKKRDNSFKKDFKNNGKKPLESDTKEKFQKKEFNKRFEKNNQHEKIQSIPLLTDNTVDTIFGRNNQGSSSLITRNVPPKFGQAKPQNDLPPKKEKKDYSIKTIRGIGFYIDNSLFNASQKEYYIKNLTQEEFKSIFNKDGLLEQQEASLSIIEKIMKVFAHELIELSTNKSLITSIFSHLMNSLFWRRTLKKYIVNDVIDDEQVQDLLTVFHRCLEFCPQEAERVYIEELEKSYIEKFVQQEFKDSILSIKSRKQALKLSNSKMDRDATEQLEIDENVENEFEAISVFPTWNELISNEKFKVRNNIDGPYPSLREYLRTQILLLREDFIHPLKEGIQSFLSNNCNHRSISVFTDCEFVSVISSDNERELVHSLNFNYPWKKVNWECSKKLAFGSLLCLFPQEGIGKNATIVKSEPIFVTVLDRKLVSKGLIYVGLSRVDDFKRLSLVGKYIMFESPAYFAGVRPVIDSLNTILSETLIDQSKFTFYDEFIKVKTQSPPHYVEKDSFMNLDVIKGDKRRLIQSDLTIGRKTNILSNWIEDNETFLDPSQNKAIQHVMRNRVSIVIGPPGCGKTFTGIEIAKLLKSHPDMKNRQLICITYTNHALDQFLEGLINYFPDIVRIGSRSKSQNEKLLNRNLSKMRHLPQYLYKQKQLCDAELRRLSIIIGATEHSIKNPDQSLLHHLAKSLIFNRALSKYPTHLYTKRNPPPETLLDKFKAWLEGDDLRRKDSMLKNMRKANRAQNSFQSLQENEQEDEEEIIIEEEQPLAQELVIEENIEENEEPEDEIEEEIEAELINEEMRNRFGYEENAITNDMEITRMYEDLEEKGDIQLETLAEIQKLELIVKQYGDIYRLPLKKRKSMLAPLRILNEKLLKTRLIEFCNLRSTYENRKYEIIMDGDYDKLKTASIIGLTSTAASMNRNLLNRLRAPVYLIEEAAELLECQITSVLHPNVEHLIMIGDEKQLQPKVNSYYLEKHCDFTVSLFERLIRNGLEFSSLNVQQRMRPEVRGLVDIFYEKLIDHESVKHFENVNGVSKNVCFIEHKKLEKTSDDVQSLTNPHEAEFLCKLSKYLLNIRQFKASEITILTPYRGQVILIKKNLKELLNQDAYRQLRVSTVDDYQGEENEIILLSLVRSNNVENLGFVKITNRIIVSLSRAKKGLYIIGNHELLRNNEDWRKVFARLKHSGSILDHLPLSCPKHSEERECIREPSDFDGVIWGGCKKPCTYRYPCGHICSLPCHHDSLHKERKCGKKCDEMHTDCGHRCPETCHHGKACPNCKAEVDYKFNSCGHTAKVACYLKNTTQLCKSKCNTLLGCGHNCTGQCGQCKLTGCGSCQAMVKDNCETCKKPYQRKCSDPRTCTNRCTFKLPCGHNCSGKCGECSASGTHKACGFNCERKLICGHTCKANHTCSNPCPKCDETCIFKCFHNVQCELKCHDMCNKCKEPCPIQCIHRKCTNLCHELCNVGPCNERCPNICKSCTHQCMGLCGEPCPPCMYCDTLKKEDEEMWTCPISFNTFEDLMQDENSRVYQLPECGHIFELESMDNCVKSFFDTEQGVSIKYLSCPICRTPIFTAPRYQKAIKESVERMEKLKYIIYKKAQEERERKEAIKAVSAEAGYASGHWFTCPSGHPYFIGECGGAMQQSTCVDCGAPIGGSSHTLLADNRLATEIDGSSAPAWPTMLNR